MKFFSDCSGECCVCGNADFCVAGHGDDEFSSADISIVIKRLDNNKYPTDREYMINWLLSKGYKYKQ